MSKLDWKNTSLYKELENRNGKYADAIKIFLQTPAVMDSIEKILDNTNDVTKNFTLHDSNHSYRVAERMWTLIPVTTQEKLSAYELGLLLLSAYLHDIGMSPDFNKVERHRSFLTTSKKNILTLDEIKEFQKWIDNNDRLKDIDIKNEIITDQNISNYILSYYVRNQHNDWSGEWIKNNLSDFTLYNYPFWNDDLIKLCKSHHYDLSHIENKVFDPVPIGDVVVNLRYLCMCLRVADVMENDPERTPDVILDHRSIDYDSLIYWLKDHHFTLNRNGNKFTVHSRPEKAYIHKAVEETANNIEDELKLCNQLIKIKPLNHSTFGDLRYYEWNLDSFLFRDIQPKDDSYEYIKSTFRPNTSKILELLTGNQLYGNPVWAFREIIQNSIDAINENVAYKLIHENKDPQKFQKKISDLHSVNVSLEIIEGEYWLVCKDDGVGMTKDIIEKYFLESGSSKRHEIKDLERVCVDRGIEFNRIGQFGIGVLSYFMIADKIVIKTKRNQQTGYEDSHSINWIFEINGAHDYGELRKTSEYSSHGTTVMLRLKSEITGNIDTWDFKFSNFIKRNISYSKCNIEYKSSCNLNNDLRISAGWVSKAQDIKQLIKKNFVDDFDIGEMEEEDGDDYLETWSRRRENDKKMLPLISEEMINSIDFIYDEGELPEIGSYRIFIPYFKLSRGNSFYYIKEENKSSGDIHISKFVFGHFWIPYFDGVRFSLNGIITNLSNKLQNRHRHNANAYVELNLTKFDKSQVSVSRHDFLYADQEFLSKVIEEKINNTFKRNQHNFINVYDCLNKKYIDSIASEKYWFFGDYNDKSLQFKKIECPIIHTQYFMDTNNYLYNGTNVSTMHNLRAFFDSDNLYWDYAVKCNYRFGV